MVEFALAKGEKVVAAVRTPSSLDDLSAKYPSTLLVVKTDIAVSGDVLAIFAAASTPCSPSSRPAR